MNVRVLQTLLSMIVFALALPAPIARAAVLVVSLLVIIFSEIRPSSFFLNVRIPIPALFLLVWALLSAVWSISPISTLIGTGQAAVILVLAGYMAARLELSQIHAAVRKGLKTLIVVGVLVEVAIFFGIALIDRGSYNVGFQGVTANPNIFAFILVLAAVTMMTRRSNNTRDRMATCVWLLVCGVLIILTRSDAGIVYLAVAVLAAISVRTLAAGGKARLVLVILALLPFLLLVSETVRESLARIVGIDENATLSGRTLIWEASLDAIGRAPASGYGFAAFDSLHVAPTQEIGVVWNLLGLGEFNAHNGYIDIALQLGVPGLLLALVMLGSATRRLARWGKSGPSTQWALLTLIVVVVYNLTETRLITPAFAWLVIALVVTSSVHATAGHSSRDKLISPAPKCDEDRFKAPAGRSHGR